MAKSQVMDQTLTIQQMAQITGLSAHTLRYYERAGLMQQVERDDNSGYRAYTQQQVSWVEFIKRLRATGMPIRDIQRFTELIHQGERTIPERMHLLKQHQSRVEAHLLEETQHLAAITAKIAYYEQHADGCQPTMCGESSTPQNEE